jgi:hypothetical protein
MRKSINCFIYALLMTLLASEFACNSGNPPAQEQAQDSTKTDSLSTNALKAIDVFQTYIVGDFDNAEQVAEEYNKGKQSHPYAKHVNRIANEKIKNLPSSLNGFYLLEESYYLYPNQKDTLVKPYLFFFEAVDDKTVRLHSIQLPKKLDIKEIKNNNANLFFEYDSLKTSPTFQPANYSWSEKGFYIKAPNEFPNGSFTLEETISKDKLEVMETLIIDGKKLTPYDTPIIYLRLQ